MLRCGMAGSCRQTVLDPLRIAVIAGEDVPFGRMVFRCKRCGGKAKVWGLVRELDWPVQEYEVLAEPPYRRAL